jgi:hypothetical protein
MPRFKNVNGVDIQLTSEEETARDVEETTWEEEKPSRAMAGLRAKRNTLLTESDWTQYNDSPLTDEVKAEWTVHRETLRDLPANTDDPADPTWPTPPG